MLTALRDISIGDVEIARGSPIPPELQLCLPPGRLEQLRANRYVEEISEELSYEQALAQLTQRVEALEAGAVAPPKRGPGRPPKLKEAVG